MDHQSRIWVAGARTLIGSAILSALRRADYVNLLAEPIGFDFCNALEVEAFFERTRPEYVFMAAGRSGGILANVRYSADLMRDNLLVACNVIGNAHRCGVHKLLYLASSCSYPRACAQPIQEEALLTGPLEPTNEAYAVAKIAGIKLCQAYRQQYGANFIVGIPANAYGPGDDFDPEDSHVIAALLRRMHEANERAEARVDIWGSGSPRREFFYVEDLADACLFVMRHYDEAEPINLGGGEDVTIGDLAHKVREIVGYQGELRFDRSKPDGMPRKQLDASRLAQMGWRPSTSLQDGLRATYEWFRKNSGQWSVVSGQ